MQTKHNNTADMLAYYKRIRAERMEALRNVELGKDSALSSEGLLQTIKAADEFIKLYESDNNTEDNG